MDSLRSPKFIAWKLGIVSGVALGALPMLGAEALAGPAIPSDTLQLVGGTNGTTQQLFEGSEPATTLSDSATFGELGQFITGTRTIVLTEPGTSNISDIVTATLTSTGVENSFTLTVTLQSDGEIPLTTTFDQSIPETGSVQNLSSDFTNLFDLNNPLPAINVSSDVSDVPEPGSLGLLGAGLAGLAFARRRRKA